jgi:Protein of unknown function (DUF4038)/Putative collagen-binding domain of a collagenase
MTTRSLGLLYVVSSRLIVVATFILGFAATPTSGSQPEKGTRAEGPILANDETPSGRSSGQLGAGTTPTFAWPTSVSAENRRFLDQKGNVYLLKTMSSWAMAQNCTNAEITKALEGLKALGFNAVTVSPFGVHMNDSFGDRYKNKARQPFFTGAPYASSFGPAWSSMDWIMSEATRLQLTVVFSLFMSWGDTGTVPDLVKAGTTNAYNFGKSVATRYVGYPNIVWHVMGDFRWSYNQGPGRGLDAIYHGIKDAEGTTHRLNIAEPANGSTSFDQFISEEGGEGYQWFKQSADTVYDYGSNSVEQFDKVFYRKVATSYPVVDIEPPYVNAPHYEGQQNQELRERNYATFIRGGAGINFGHEKWWPFGVTGLFDGGPDWLNIISEPPQLCAKYAWTLLDTFVQDRSWTPDNGKLLKTGLGSGDDKAASGYSRSAGVVYFPTSRRITVDTTAIAGGRNVRLRWYDPTNGTYTEILASEPKSSSRSVSYPSAHKDGSNDWVLVVDGV